MARASAKTPLVPARDWLAGYDRRWLRPDLVAGLTTSAVVIPKAMAYATIAGLPPEVGLYTAFLPAIVYAVLGTSRVLSVSSTSTIAILGAAALGTAATSRPAVDLATATCTLTLLVGAILALAPLLRLGFLANFISDPVLTGFKVGIGLVIVADQLPKLLGVHIEKTGFLRDLVAVAHQVPATSLATLAVALGTFVFIGLLEKFAPRAPVPLLAMAGGIAASALLGLRERGVAVVGAIPGGFPAPAWPDLALAADLWPAAAGIALMSFTETIAAGRAFARPDDPRPDSNRELLGLGGANLAGGFFGAMPAGGGTSQTAVNLGAGARTQVTGLVTAAMALATMLFLAPVMGSLPGATLAAVVIAYSIGLVSTHDIVAIKRIRAREFRWAVAACAGVVVLGTLKGIVVAVLLSMASLLAMANDPPLHVLGRKPGTSNFRPRSDEHPEDESFPGLLIVRTEGRLYFGNVHVLAEKLRGLLARERPKVLLLDCSAVPGFEFTALRMLVEAEERLRRDGIELWLCDLSPEALDLVRRTPLAGVLGRERMHFNVERAVEAWLARERR